MRAQKKSKDVPPSTSSLSRIELFSLSVQASTRHALTPLLPPRHPRRRTRTSPRAATAMVNVDFSPALVLGMGLIGGGLTLYQLRRFRPGLSRDFDVIVSSVAIFSGGILVFQGWRLDPLLLFCQLLTAGMAVAFAVETLRLREEVAEAEVKWMERREAGLREESTHARSLIPSLTLSGTPQRRPVPVRGRAAGPAGRAVSAPGRPAFTRPARGGG